MDTQKVPEWAELLKVLGNPVRLAVLAELIDGPKCVEQVRDLLQVRQPNASQHLSVLRHTGLVGCYRDGGRRCYCLTRPSLAEALFAFLGGVYPVVEIQRRLGRGGTAASNGASAGTHDTAQEQDAGGPQQASAPRDAPGARAEGG